MQHDGTSLTFRIDPRRITVLLAGMVIVLASAHVAVHALSQALGISSDRMFGLKRFFDMGAEANLPTYLSALNLLFADGLLILIARLESVRNGKPHWHWWGLAAGFLMMSFDEATMIHEGLIGTGLTAHFGRGDGILYVNWYKVYVPAVLAISLVYLPFLLKLPKRYSLRLLAAGAVFLGSAIGIETLESYVASHRLGYIGVVRLFEETGEMLGIVLATHTFMLYLVDHSAFVSLRFRERSASSGAHALAPADGMRTTHH